MSREGPTISADRAPTRPSAAKRTRRFQEVDGLRAIAAFAVISVHVSQYFPVSHSELVAYLVERNDGVPAAAGVLFFVISGFVMYRPFVAARAAGRPLPPLLPYAVRRAVRIVPAYWLALAVVSVWFGFGYIGTAQGIVRYFGFMQIYGNIHTLGQGLGVAWTLCVEVTFYLVLPPLALAARRIGRRRPWIFSELILFGAMVLTSVIWQIVILQTVSYDTGWVVPMLSWLPGTIELIAVGMLLAALSVEVERRPTPRRAAALITRRPWLAWLSAIALFYVVGQATSLGPTVYWVSTNLAKLVACGLLVAPFVLGGPGRGVIARVLRARPLVFIGTVSYGIYLWHYPLLTKLLPSMYKHGEVETLVVVSLMSLWAGALSYYLIEHPTQRLAIRWLSRRRAGGPAASLAGPLVAVGPVAPVVPAPPAQAGDA
jgi:peptidoglycan/LPS O-acetylase OafA/YrhL